MCCSFVLLAFNTGSRVGDLGLVIGLFLVPILLLIGVLLLLRGMLRGQLQNWRDRLQRRGYLGIRDYLGKLPQTQEETLDAVELTLKGAVLFVLGLLFFPLIVISLVPLYYGVRKLAAIRLGLHNVEEDTQGG